MDNKYILSICIPTYNRYTSISCLVESLLNIDEKRFNIVVQDNCSTDETENYFKTISSSRVEYRRNKANKGAAFNYMESLRNNEGVYSLFMIDKDLIDVSLLTDFINILENRKLEFGYIELGLKSDCNNYISTYKKGEESILKTAYLSKHPTGFFYRSEMITDQLINNYFNKEGLSFPFPFEIINAYLGIKHCASVLCIPLLRQEEDEDAVRIKSKSYDLNNLFFAPEKRIDAFGRYFENLQSLKLSKDSFMNIFKALYKRSLYNVSLNYLSVMRNPVILLHYGIEKKDISIVDMSKYIFLLYKSYSKLRREDYKTQNVAILLSVKQFLVVFVLYFKKWLKK